MKKAFIYRQSLMNGTVTMETAVTVFASRELAEQVRRDVMADNRLRDLGGMHVRYSEVEEINVYETRDEVPFYHFAAELAGREEE